MTPRPPDHLLDELTVARLLQDWGLWRDTGQWALLRAAYAPDAWMRTTWFDGPAMAFVDASIALWGKGAMAQHFIGPSTVQVKGDRAIAETRVMLLLRDQVQGVAVDVSCFGRFIDRLLRIDGQWRLLHRVPIYEKDVLTPVDPAQTPSLDRAALAAFPSGYRHVAYLQSQAGAQIVRDLPGHNSEAQHLLYASTAAWLREGRGTVEGDTR